MITGATTAQSTKDRVTGLIWKTWVTSSNQIKVGRYVNNDSPLLFPDGQEERVVPSTLGIASAICVRNGVICLKYLDLEGNLSQRFSKDGGETWVDTF